MTAPAPLQFGSPERPYIELPPLRGARSNPVVRTVGSSREAQQGRGDCITPENRRSPETAACPPASSATTPLPALLADLPSTAAIEAVLRRRLAQLAKGFTPDKDANLPIGFLLNESQRYAADAFSWLQRAGKDPAREHYRNKVVAMLALGIAELDRLDRVMERDHG